MGLVAAQHMESISTRDQTNVPCIGRQILNHWTTREALLFGFLIKHLKCLLILPVLQSYPLPRHNYFIYLIFFPKVNLSLLEFVLFCEKTCVAGCEARLGLFLVERRKTSFLKI